MARVGEVGPSGGAGVARHLYFRTHWIDEERIRRDQEKSRRESAKTRRISGGNLPKPGEYQEGARKRRRKRQEVEPLPAPFYGGKCRIVSPESLP